MKTETKIEYYSNGNKSCETPYVNDKAHGLAILWHSNGNKWYEILYKSNIQHGSEIEFKY